MKNRMNETNQKEINFDSIAAMMCGKELTEEQKKDVERFNQEYDEAHERKTNR